MAGIRPTLKRIRSILKRMWAAVSHRFFSGNRIKGKPGNRVRLGNGRHRHLRVTFEGTDNSVVIEDGCTTQGCSVYIHGNGNRIFLARGGYYCDVDFYIEDDGNEIRAGKACRLCGRAQLAAVEGTKIIIGEDCLFSRNIDFRTGDSHPILDMDGKRINPCRSITIGDHVWIGQNVLCLKGTNVPSRCIVGAGSLLNKHYVEEHCIFAGNPAKVVKKDVQWARIRTKSYAADEPKT